MLFSRSDIKYTFRKLAKSPGFFFLSTSVLAGGLGLSIFAATISYIMAYKTIPLTHGDRIVEICAGGGLAQCLPLKAYEFASFRDEIQTLENVGVYSAQHGNVESNGTIHEARIASTQWNMFQLSETSSALGRTLIESDSEPQASPVAVLAHDFWQVAFDSDQAIVGKSIALDGRLTEVVGVMPAGYKFPNVIHVWIPARAALTEPVLNDMTLVSVFARRVAGVSQSTAGAEINALMYRMRQRYPALELDCESTRTNRLVNQADSGFVTTLPNKSFGNLGNKLALAIINLMAGLVFLLACINVGTLLLARTNEKLKDLSIRVALGAPRKRLLAQTLGESIVIAFTGALLAVLVAGAGLEALSLFTTTIQGELHFWLDFKVDASTVWAAAIFAVLTVFFTSALPSWKLVNGDFNSVMQDGTRGAVGLTAGKFSRSLVTVAIALITTFLYLGTVGANSLWSMGRTFQFIESEGMSSAEIDTEDQFLNEAARLQFFQALGSNLRTNPDVLETLLIGVIGDSTITLDGVDYLSEQDKPTVPVQFISGDIGTIGARLLQGQYFDESLNTRGSPSALVSRSTAESLWPNQSPIGQSLRIDTPNDSTSRFQVIGMVSDTPVDGSEMFNQESDMIYVPLGQLDATRITAIIRSNLTAELSAQFLRKAVLDLNSGVSSRIESWAEGQQMVTSVIRYGVSIVVGCGLFAFMISIAGIFGLTKNSIVLRTQEIGTRRALGATDKMIRKTFTRNGTRQMLLGIFIAVLVTSPFTLIVYATMGASFILTGAGVAAIVISIFFACVIATIRHTIQQVLIKEPAELLHYQ